MSQRADRSPHAGWEIEMKESIDCPKLVEQSKKVQKGQHWLVELLVFVTVYIIAAFGEMLILLPGELVLLNTNTAYQLPPGIWNSCRRCRCRLRVRMPTRC